MGWRDRGTAYQAVLAEERVQAIEGLVVGDQEQLADLVAQGHRAALQIRGIGVDQRLALEERLRLMDDLVMTKSEEITSLEGQLEAAKEAGAAKEAPAKKAKPNGGAQSKQAP